MLAVIYKLSAPGAELHMNGRCIFFFLCDILSFFSFLVVAEGEMSCVSSGIMPFFSRKQSPRNFRQNVLLCPAVCEKYIATIATSNSFCMTERQSECPVLIYSSTYLDVLQV